MSNKKGISIKDYFNAPSSITQPTAEPSNESAGNTSTSPPNEETNDKQQPPLSENQPYHSDSSYVFPKIVFGKQKRSCKHDWFKRFSWLDYNAFDDSVTCYVCKHQNNHDNLKTERKENTFLKKHQSSQCHRAASTYQMLIPPCPDVAELFDNKENEAQKLNRRCFMAILDSIQYLARQEIPLRGHGSDEDSNFFQLLMMKSKEFPELKAWLEKKQGKFVTHDVHNEILTIMSNSVLRSLLKKIEGNIYSTMCDEYTDCSNHEQLTFCLRWVEALKAHETFLGFYEIPDIKSSTIVSVIKDIFTRYQLSMENF